MPLPPVNAIELFPGERTALLELLRELTSDQWNLPTACEGWSVHDVALHLLGDDIGRLSGGRDNHINPEFVAGFDISTFTGLVSAIDRQNDTWLRAARRISPQLTIELLAFTGGALDLHFGTLDPNEIKGPVDWAGPAPAPVWLDLAREYTERWHHQQHIRDAVKRPGMTERQWLRPVFDTFVRGLQRPLVSIERPPGTTLALHINGEGGGTWYAVKTVDGWDLNASSNKQPAASISMSTESAWKLFTRGISPEEARNESVIEGDEELTDAVLHTVSILAG